MNCVYGKIFANQSICKFQKKHNATFFSLSFFFQFDPGWLGTLEVKELFLKLKSKVGRYHNVHTTPETSAKKLTLTVVEMQQLADIEKTDSEEGSSCLEYLLFFGSKKVCSNVKTDRDELKNVVYSYLKFL